jgi:hypothetical protein
LFADGPGHSYPAIEVIERFHMCILLFQESFLHV